MDWLARWARDTPSAPFLLEGSSTLDFATAHARVTRMAGSIRQRFEPGARIGVVARPSIDDVLLLLAVPAAGAVLIPLPAAAEADARTALAAAGGLDAILGPGEIGSGSAPLVEPDPEKTHCAIFTSGTSGTARAVRLTWGNIEASAAASALHLDHTAADRWLAVLPLHHVGGLSIIWRSVRQGAAVVLAGPFAPGRTVSLLATGTVTLASFVSPMLESLADVPLPPVPGFRLGLVGGGPVTERALTAGGMRLLPTYGMTETASQVATADPTEPHPDRLVILPDVRLQIRRDGRITVEGPMVSPGSLGGPDRTGPLVTGDLGRLTSSGELQVLGRADDVIVTGGENVMPERVERVAATIAGAGDVAVVGLPDSRWGAVVVAVYTGSATPEELTAAMRTRVPSHEVPRRWLRVESIPRLGIGKVDRTAVAALLA